MEKLFFHLTIGILLMSCSTQSKETEQPSEVPPPTRISMETTLGEIIIELSDKTPLHRDNFVSFVEEGAYDSLLFHRVIEGFVVQGGDPDSKNAEPGVALGYGSRDYMTPAEFDTTLFHKRGALGAARDGNPERSSGAMQFYFVQASKPLADSTLDKAEERINGWLKDHYSLKAPENKLWYDSVASLMVNENYEGFRAISDTIKSLAEDFSDFETYTIPEAHRAVYRETGGTPFLDQNYTVFGEVISGMAVIDSIAAQPVDESISHRPLEDVRILSAKVIE